MTKAHVPALQAEPTFHGCKAVCWGGVTERCRPAGMTYSSFSHESQEAWAQRIHLRDEATAPSSSSSAWGNPLMCL
jgi:hypothetical protein